jgi:ribonuclease D
VTEPQLVDDQAAFDELVDTLAVLPADGGYALDTEFHRERTYWPRLALIQIAWPGGLALVDPLAVDVRGLADVLRGPALFVAHAADQDLEVLEQACGVAPARLFDTQIAAGFLGMVSSSLSNLAEKLLGRRLVKGDRLTDWSRRPLTADQQAYAASDVAYLLDIAAELRSQLAERGRLEWAEQECQTLLERSRGHHDPDTAWWKLRDSRSLRGASRGVAQAVAAWRERRAMESDVPPRFVLSDLALLSIAHKPPKDAETLSHVRGLDGRNLKGSTGQQLLEAVRAGQRMQDAELRLPKPEEIDRHLRPAVALAAAWVSQLGRDEAIDPALLATRSDLIALLRGDDDCRLATGWRAAVVGDPVKRLVAGQAALAFDGHGGLVLEARSFKPFTG